MKIDLVYFDFFCFVLKKFKRDYYPLKIIGCEWN